MYLFGLGGIYALFDLSPQNFEPKVVIYVSVQTKPKAKYTKNVKTKNHNDMFSVNSKKIKIQSFLKLRRDIIQSYPDIISYVRNGKKKTC